MRTFIGILFLALSSTVLFAESPKSADSLVNDDYTDTKLKIRKPLRGDWKIQHGTASVTQDDELYKKFKNHGPIMVYEVPHDDASAEVTFKPNGCKSVVFTMDAKQGGHAFRVKLSTKAPGTTLTYIKKPDAEKATPVFLDKTLPKLAEGEWATLRVKVVGDKATVQLGETTIDVKHAMIDQPKKIAKLGFSFGSLELKQFRLATAN